MQLTSIPAKFPIPWANGAVAPYVHTIPIPSQIGITAGAASLQDGFPPLNFTVVGAGGVPPFGADFNGIFKEITQWSQWYQAGGLITYDATFSSGGGGTNIDGYPSGAVIASAAYPFGHYWQSLVDNNIASPDTAVLSWSGWQTFPLPGSIQPAMLSPAAVPRPIVFPQTADNLILSNDGTSPNTVVDANPGRVPDQADTTWLPLAAAMGKSISGSWVAGGTIGLGAQAGLDSGSAAAASATYNVYIIGKLGMSITNRSRTSNVATITSAAHGLGVGGTVRVQGVGFGYDGTYAITAVAANTISYANTGSDEGSTAVALAIVDGFDVLLSQQSVNAYPNPILPSGWTVAQCLGSIITDGTSHIRPFTQVGDHFVLTNSVLVVNNVSMPTVSRTLAGFGAATGCPVGIKVLLNIRIGWNTAGSGASANITCPDEADAAVSAISPTPSTLRIDGANNAAGEFWIRTNTSGQLGYRGSSAGSGFSMSSLGWRDPRRRLF